MKISEYSEQALVTIQKNTNEDPKQVFVLGLLGELGSLASVRKKRLKEIGDGVTDPSRAIKTSLVEELGDILWYINALAYTHETCLENIVQNNLRRLNYKGQVNTFEEYDDVIIETLKNEHGKVPEEIPKQFLGFLRNAIKIIENTTKPEELEESLGDVVWYCTLATKGNLNRAAQNNINKTRKLYIPTTDAEYSLFDNDLPIEEQIPRKFEVIFDDRNRQDLRSLRIVINGIIVGDSLSDNSRDSDGYRYHDIFHLAYLACLGWSPVTRALLNRKRKSSKETDENEDGARATFVEETVAITIFQYAKKHDYFELHNEVDEYILNLIQQLVSGLEVEIRSLGDWREAIKQGFNIFRQLKKHGGGRIVVDLNNRELKFFDKPSSNEIYKI